MRLLIYILIISLHLDIIAQRPPDELQFSYEIEEKIVTGELQTTLACYYYTFIGEYVGALSTYDIPISWGVDTLKYENVNFAKAIDRIIEVAKNRSIVIISESHLKPQHRIFASEVIDSLSRYGFHHLGIETLNPNMDNVDQLQDSLLNERGYPFRQITGFYTREPQMAKLVRSALRKQYRLFGYERHGRIPGKDRDEIQADNIIQYMKERDVSKVILLCGWHHSIESDELKRGDSYYMAKYIKEKTGIDPLTIYQDNFTEKIRENEHIVLQSNLFNEPSVLVDDQDRIIRLSDHVDVEVIHPKTTYIHDRPSWLFQKGTCKEYIQNMDSITIGYPLFIQAYYPGEQELGVPIDIVELKERFDNKPLILEPGKYVIKIDNKKDSPQYSEITIE